MVASTYQNIKEVETKAVPTWLITLTVMLGALVAIIDSSIVNVAIPAISGNLGATTSEITGVSTIYILANVIVMPLNGYLTSLMGRKNYYAISLILFTLASFLCGVAWDLNSLVAFRLIQGIGGGALIPTAQAIMLETYPKEKFGQAMAIFGLGAMVGPAIGPTLGGWLVETYNWRLIFYINVPLGIVATIMTLLFIKNPAFLSKPEGKFDFVGLTSMIMGVCSLQYVLEKGQEDDWFDSRKITALAIIAVISLIFFVFWELRTKNPVVDLSVFKDRTFLTGNLVGVVTGFGLYGLNMILPLFLASILHYNSMETGMAIFPGAIATAISMPFAGRLADKFDPRMVIWPGMVIFALSGWELGDLTAASGYWDFFFPRFLQGLALGLIFVPLSTITMGQVPRDKMSSASGIYSLVRQLGGSIGIAILTTLLSYYSKAEYTHLSEYFNPYNNAANERLQAYQGLFISKGFSSEVAYQQALKLVSGTIQTQALVLSYDNLFKLVAVIFLVSSLLLIFLKKKKAAVGGEPVMMHAE